MYFNSPPISIGRMDLSYHFNIQEEEEEEEEEKEEEEEEKDEFIWSTRLL